jgi:DNA repair exonuclease SbcCD nuclease subunit
LIRFIHTSDWQLGKPFARMAAEASAALQDARLDVIDTIGRLAISEGAGNVLVAGDVFDAPEPHDRTVRQALLRMGRHPCSWWLLPGNHDYARAEGLWDRLRRDAPGNVNVLLGPKATKLGENAWILPAPLMYRRTEADPTLGLDLLETPAEAVRIGLAHGPIQAFGRDGDTKNLIAPDRAKRARLDYLALGDWHGQLTVGDRTAYSGTPEPDDFGREVTGGALVVTLEAPGAVPALRFVATGKYAWRQERWDVAHANDLLRQVTELRGVEDLARLVLRLEVTGVVGLSERVRIREVLESELGHEVRWLDLSLDDLYLRPTADDLGDIDAYGVLRSAADRLQAMASADSPDGRVASAALERLFVETLRARRRGEPGE